jgi:hypothetical protein
VVEPFCAQEAARGNPELISARFSKKKVTSSIPSDSSLLLLVGAVLDRVSDAFMVCFLNEEDKIYISSFNQ